MTESHYPRALTKYYGESYYSSYRDHEYRWGEPAWHGFFAGVADAIVSELNPHTVLDAGCGIGFLVAALRERGVEAWGIDVSEYAIAQVPVEFRSYCSVASVTDELERDYDLIACLEVLEHLPPDLASTAAENLSRHTDNVLFSSSPNEFREPTHVNVQPMEHWAGLFARYGFFRNVDLDAAFVAPQAIHFRRTGQTAAEVARTYERWHWRTLSELRDLRAARLEEHEELAAARKELMRLRSEAKSAKASLQTLESTRTFRYTRLPRRIYTKLRTTTRHSERRTYGAWIREFDTLTPEDCRVIRADTERLQQRPLVSVLMPVHDPPIRYLARAIESVRSQLYENWELCIADDASTDPEVGRKLRDYAADDPRIKVVFREGRGNISAASNSALELCTGEFVALLDHDDELPPHALYLVVREINRHPDAAIVFSDEDKIDADGRRSDPYFKPDWNPDLFRSQNCISHLGVYRRSVMNEVGGFRPGFEGSQDYDLALRIVERVRDDQIRHIPAVLYHWRMIPGSAARSSAAKPYAIEAARAALTDHLRRTGRPAEVSASANPDFSRLTYSLPRDPPLVSVVIPTRDGAHLETCIESLRTRTSYPRTEIIVVDNQSVGERTRTYLRSLQVRRIARILQYDDVFDHSAMCNMASRQASGEMLCLFNDDVEVLTPGWLEELVSHAVRPEVGAVGAMLVYPDGRIQHAGVVLGFHEIAGHAHQFLHPRSQGYLSRAALIQNYTAVTGACLAVQASVYEEVGGFDEEHLPHVYNDVDFCLRLREAGYWNVWTPYAELVHHESATRRLNPPKDEEAYARHREQVDYLRARWGPLLTNDPAYNPNLTLESENFALAWPPRTEWPWSRRPTNGKAHVRRWIAAPRS